MLANVGGDNLTVLQTRMSEDVLNEIIAVLVACNVDEGDARAINATLADPIKIAAEELSPSNLEALLDNLGGVLISAVFGSVTNDMVDSTASVRWSAMLTDVLNAPVSELSVSHDVNVGKDFLNAGTLQIHS